MQLRGLLWMTAGLLVALAAGFVGYITLTQAAPVPANEISGARQASTTTTQVVAAVERIGVRTMLDAESLQLIDVPVDTVPEGALTSIEDEAVGRITMVDLYPGEVILAQRLADPNHVAGDGRTALILEEGRVLMAIGPGDLMSNIGVLKPGDRVDLYFSFEFTGAAGSKAEEMTFSLLQNVSLEAMIGGTVPEGGTSPQDPRALLLTLDPQDVAVLKHMLDREATIDVVLRAPDDDDEFDVEPVDEEYIVNGWDIPR